ncbi:MAG: GAF domain-containing protein [Caldilineales bacterium]|nr:GAF domain-containing protein [Caldilineales bacterium]
MNGGSLAGTPTALIELQAASQALARVRTDEQAILDNLQQQVRRLLPPGRIHLLLFHDEGSQLHAWNRQGEALPSSYFETPVAQGIIGWLRQTKESLLVGDFQRDWDYLPAQPSYDSPNPPRSAVFVPLVVGDEVFGALSVQNEQADVLTSDHLWQLKILANQAAAAIHAGRLLRAARWRTNLLQTIAEVTRSLTSILDLDGLLSHVVDVIAEAFDYYHVQIYVVEEGSDRAVFRASSGDATHEQWRKIGRYVRIGREGIIGWTAAHGKTWAAPDVSVDPLYVPDDPHLLPDTRSEIAIPLLWEQDVLGVLDVQSNEVDDFDDEDQFVLNSLAEAVALAVANARLYAQVQEDAWITVALLEVGEATNRLTELGDVVETVVRLAPLLTGVVTAAIWLRAEGGDAFEPMGHWGIHEEMIRLFTRQPLEWDENPVLRLVDSTRQPVIARGAQIDELLAPMTAQALLADALAFLPLQAKGDLIGMMAVSVEERDGPAIETRLALLKGIADQSASAIENAQLIAAQREEAWVSTALLQVAEAMGRAGDLAETLDIVARLTTVLSGLDRCTIFLRKAQSDQFMLGISHSLERTLSPWPLPDPDGASAPVILPLLDHLLQTRTPLLDSAGEYHELVPDEWAEIIGAGGWVGLPLVADDRVVGVMLVDTATGSRVQNSRLLDILSGIANQAAVAIERARLQRVEIVRQRLDAELQVARSIQQGFLPESIPSIPGYEIAARWEPAYQIGGDFYDFIPLAAGRLGLVVADVADKGIPAALYMALSRTTMRLVTSRNPSPARALLRVNTAILDNSYSDMFVSIYFAVLDPARHTVTYASGGHGLALKAGGEGVTFLRGRGTVLGVFPDIRIEEHATELGPGEYLIIYTDGIIDAVNSDMVLFDEERLVQTILQHQGLPADEMLRQIHAAVRAWEGKSSAFDDFTLVVVRRQPDP